MVTIKDYNKLLKDRPRKFTAEEVGYTEQGGDYQCSGCRHWYKGPVAQRSVCEIYVGVGFERMVPRTASCRFWTRDGMKFPLLQEESKGEDDRDQKQ